MESLVGRVEVIVLDISDPSDHAQLFRALGDVVERIDREHPGGNWERDVLLSAGTPQAQTLWVILVQAGLLRGRMLQVIPSAFVPDPHPRPIREVHLDIEGFPEVRALRDEVARLRAAVRLESGELVGASPPMRRLLSRMARVSAVDVPVLLLGETGTGKELVARAIHAGSARSAGPFVAENCSAFAEGLLASELFGHESGAFTGAVKRRRGLFEQAHGGTLFLDEVGEMAPKVQAHLLRVLEDGTLRRVGGETTVRVDVRIIAATHRSLEGMVRTGEFREDLYYRLRGAELVLPPLRERSVDLPLLVERFLGEIGRADRLRVTSEAMAALVDYWWPGNVRELRAEVVRWSVFCEDEVNVKALAPEIQGGAKDLGEAPPSPMLPTREVPVPLSDAVQEAERTAIRTALEHHGGNISRAARSLRIDRNTLKRKMAAFGLR
jgi:DNA-binding NtrC family response regulator